MILKNINVTYIRYELNHSLVMSNNRNSGSNRNPTLNKHSDSTNSDSTNSTKKIDLMTKFRAVMILHALGDTIGFKNGDWEFNYHQLDKRDTLDYVNELIYEFIALGGVNGIDLSEWKISDDTFLHIAIGKSLMHYTQKNGIDDALMLQTKKYLQKEARQMINEFYGDYIDENGKSVKFNRYIGITTANSIENFTKDHDARNMQYNEKAGGNGAAMRTPVIGLCFNGENKRDELIQYSVISSQLTHNNALGYLGGFNAALFTALAIEDVPIKKWPYILIDYLRSDKLKAFMSLKNLDQVYDHTMYIRYWQKYIDTKFDENKNPLIIRANTNPMHRIRYYYENFHKGTSSKEIGASGFLCMIMAYDALLDCDGHWEKLIVYAMLHSGDSDTIGAVAGALYGAKYGFGDVPEQMLTHIERGDEIKKLALELYKKFASK